MPARKVERMGVVLKEERLKVGYAVFFSEYAPNMFMRILSYPAELSRLQV